MNLFATVLTYPAPSRNYRGETELNRQVLQKVTDGRFDYAIFSPESMRNALREILASYGQPCNRERLHPVSGKGKSGDGEGDKQGLAVKFKEYPDPDKFIDDFFFGYLLAVKSKELDKLRKEKGEKYPLKRDSVFRSNLARALEPYRHNAVFSQSPEIKDSPWKPGGGDAKASSALLHAELVVSAFQYPFALALADCQSKDDKPEDRKRKDDWTKKLLQAIGELTDVAGNQGKSLYEFGPASIIVRLTKQLVAGYQTYGFRTVKQPNGEEAHLFPEIVNGILHQVQVKDENGKLRTERTNKNGKEIDKPVMVDQPDYPGNEFYLGGKIVKDMTDDQVQALETKGVTLDRDPRRLLALVAEEFLGGK